MDPIESLSKKIHRLSHRLEKAEENIPKIEKKESEFRAKFGSNPSRYTWYGFLCLLALVFDLIVNKNVMGFLESTFRVRVIFFALIFMMIDAILATLASGVLASDIQSQDKMRMTWRPVLLGIGFIKAVLYIIFEHIVKVKDDTHAVIFTVLLILFIILIYAILDRSGAGISYIFGNLKFAIIKWTSDKPNEIKKQIKKHLIKINSLISRYGQTITNTYQEHNLMNYFTWTDHNER